MSTLVYYSREIGQTSGHQGPVGASVAMKYPSSGVVFLQTGRLPTGNTNHADHFQQQRSQSHS